MQIKERLGEALYLFFELNIPAWLVWQRLLFAYPEYPFSLIYYRAKSQSVGAAICSPKTYFQPLIWKISYDTVPLANDT